MNSMYSKKILMVDDEQTILTTFETVFERAGYTHFVPCRDSRKAMTLAEREQPDLVLLDLSMPQISGEELLPRLINILPEVPIIIVTGNDDVSKAIYCIKKGAFDFLVKPVERERLLVTVEHALISRSMSQENTRLRERLLLRELKSPEAFEAMVTNNEKMLAIFRYVEAISETDKPVLICGETGTGKELMARAVHTASGRSGAFVAVNVSGLDDMVFTDTLFGHVKGAFTGADTVRKGLVEQANGGTLFLDEIGDLHQSSQVKLLRLLQEQEYLPLGADHPKKTSERVVAATNVDLLKLKDSGVFRADLYYRLNSHVLTIPPLRERRDDLPVLVDHFVKKSSQALGRKIPQLPNRLLELFFAYSFPGNTRELESLIFNAVSSTPQGPIPISAFKSRMHDENYFSSSHLDSDKLKNSLSVQFGEVLPTMDEIKGLLIDEALRRSDGNKSKAAGMLGMTRQALNWREKKSS